MSKYTIMHGDALGQLRLLPDHSIDSLITDPPAGIAFMGHDWDKDKGGRDKWISWLKEILTEAKRTMKPGAHGLVWALPRTSHWTATALEDAGFEVRDVITHLFSSGFPKSLNISKMIDSDANVKRETIGFIKQRSTNVRFTRSHNIRSVESITIPSTDDAQKWDGWGTALKPASEHWILIRNPIEEKTITKNVLKHGTGAINIDASRIEHNKKIVPWVRGIQQKNFTSFKKPFETTYLKSNGRWPANLVLSHTIFCTDNFCEDYCAIKTLNKQNGAEKESDNASRFFYVSKPTKTEKNYGCDSLLGKNVDIYNKYSSKNQKEPQGNHHPTVKPIKLMQYFIRMVTPPGGVVLDMFGGSGTTGVAAIASGFNVVVIEQEKEFIEIIKKRLENACI